MRCQLSRSEEKALQNFPLNGYITRLIELLGHTIMMDFQVDTKCKCMGPRGLEVYLSHTHPDAHSITKNRVALHFHRLHYANILVLDGYFPEHHPPDGQRGSNYDHYKCHSREHAVYGLGRLGCKALRKDFD